MEHKLLLHLKNIQELGAFIEHSHILNFDKVIEELLREVHANAGYLRTVYTPMRLEEISGRIYSSTEVIIMPYHIAFKLTAYYHTSWTYYLQNIQKNKTQDDILYKDIWQIISDLTNDSWINNASKEFIKSIITRIKAQKIHEIERYNLEAIQFVIANALNEMYHKELLYEKRKSETEERIKRRAL